MRTKKTREVLRDEIDEKLVQYLMQFEKLPDFSTVIKNGEIAGFIAKEQLRHYYKREYMFLDVEYTQLYIKVLISELNKTISVLKCNGVSIAVIKGLPLNALIYGERFREIYVNDIDFLINEKDLTNAVHILNGLGFVVKEDQKRKYSLPHVFDHHIGDVNHYIMSKQIEKEGLIFRVVVELHLNLTELSYKCIPSEKLMYNIENSDVLGFPVPVLSLEDIVVTLIAHEVKHYLMFLLLFFEYHSELSIRGINRIAQLFAQLGDRIDINKLMHRLIEFDLYDDFVFIITVIIKIYGENILPKCLTRMIVTENKQLEKSIANKILEISGKVEPYIFPDFTKSSFRK